MEIGFLIGIGFLAQIFLFWTLIKLGRLSGRPNFVRSRAHKILRVTGIVFLVPAAIPVILLYHFIDMIIQHEPSYFPIVFTGCIGLTALLIEILAIRSLAADSYGNWRL